MAACHNAVDAEPVAAEPLAAASAEAEAEPAAQQAPWSEVEGEAYDTLVGTGLNRGVFIAQWGGFGTDGRFRPEPDSLVAGIELQELSGDEVAEFEMLLDLHEPMVREASEVAFDTLREALDRCWASGGVVVEPALSNEDLRAKSEEAVRSMGHIGGYSYCDAFTCRGWSVRAFLRSVDHPDFHAAFKQVRLAVHTREVDAREFLASVL